jgi:hypothetical protein
MKSYTRPAQTLCAADGSTIREYTGNGPADPSCCHVSPASVLILASSRIDGAARLCEIDTLSLGVLRELFDYDYWARDRQLQACAGLTEEQFVRQLGGSFPSLRTP